MSTNYSWEAVCLFLVFMSVVLIGSCTFEKLQMLPEPPPLKERSFAP